MRHKVASAPVEAPAPVAVTLSAGLAEARAGDTLGDLLRRADAALYEAKAQGRNRLVLAPHVETAQSAPVRAAL